MDFVITEFLFYHKMILKNRIEDIRKGILPAFISYFRKYGKWSLSKNSGFVILRLGDCVAIIAEKGDERRSFIC